MSKKTKEIPLWLRVGDEKGQIPEQFVEVLNSLGIAPNRQGQYFGWALHSVLMAGEARAQAYLRTSNESELYEAGLGSSPEGELLNFLRVLFGSIQPEKPQDKIDPQLKDSSKPFYDDLTPFEGVAITRGDGIYALPVWLFNTLCRLGLFDEQVSHTGVIMAPRLAALSEYDILSRSAIPSPGVGPKGLKVIKEVLARIKIDLEISDTPLVDQPADFYGVYIPESVFPLRVYNLIARAQKGLDSRSKKAAQKIRMADDGSLHAYDLARMSEDELQHIRELGETSVATIREILERYRPKSSA